MDRSRYFRHFKGNYYKLLHIAFDSETQEPMCVYQALYGEHKIWVRPEAMFFEEIERDGRRMRRFEEIEKEDLPEEARRFLCTGNTLFLKIKKQ